MKLVYRYRVKSLTGLLNQQARVVNVVWNYCNDRQKDALRFGRRWHTGFDLIKLTTGCSKELGLHSGTVNDICQRYASSRALSRRPYLRYRGRKAMGWVPLKGREPKREGSAFRFAGCTFRVFYSRPLPEGKILDGTNFSRDRRGNWFLNIVVEMESAPVRVPVRGVGIDLGLKMLATLSDGSAIEAPHFYWEAEAALACAQRAQEAANQGHPRQDRQPQTQFSAYPYQRDHRRVRLYRGRQRQRAGPSQNQHGEVGLRCRLVVLPYTTGVQGC